MRDILTISLPQKVAKKLKAKAKRYQCSVSALVLNLFQLEEEKLISEEDLLKLSQKAKKEHQSGQTKELNSLADLM